MRICIDIYVVGIAYKLISVVSCIAYRDDICMYSEVSVHQYLYEFAFRADIFSAM